MLDIIELMYMRISHSSVITLNLAKDHRAKVCIKCPESVEKCAWYDHTMKIQNNNMMWIFGKGLSVYYVTGNFWQINKKKTMLLNTCGLTLRKLFLSIMHMLPIIFVIVHEVTHRPAKINDCRKVRITNADGQWWWRPIKYACIVSIFNEMTFVYEKLMMGSFSMKQWGAVDKIRPLLVGN